MIRSVHQFWLEQLRLFIVGDLSLTKSGGVELKTGELISRLESCSYQDC